MHDAVDVPVAPRLRAGPPLHLERPGRVTELLSPYLRPARLERFREVLGRRTRHLTALLERVHDPHNLSACIRSCDAFGIQHLHIVPEVGVELKLSRKVASGAQRWVSVQVHASTSDAVAALRASGYALFATALGGKTPTRPIRDTPLDQPVCVVFGNERDGVSTALLEAVDGNVTVPMYGFVDSFNISVAFALAMHTLRDRMAASGQVAGELSPRERTRLLDRWVLSDVPRAEEVLAELGRRAGRTC